jgi:hypothetical protein
MNTCSNSNPAIKLNTTFTRLFSGAATISDIRRESAMARSALFASEDAVARCRREWHEAREQFFAALAY